MIVSASRRTDIPALYLPWLSRRLQEGFCLVRNPHNPHRISRVDLRPQAVDGMVLWTKNPIPLLQLPAALARIPFYIQCTVTAYGQDLEPGLPPKPEILAAFRELAARLGPARLVWRYDPILFSAAYSLETHVTRFADLAAQLEGCTDACIVSFLDSYRCTARAERALGLYRPAPESAQALLRRLVPIARAHGMSVQACAEAADLSALGVERAHCVDPARFARLTGEALRVPRDRSQRPACGCAASVDIGAYDSCLHGCAYCYANHGRAVDRQAALHDPDSPLLLGRVDPAVDVVRDAPAPSYRTGQTGLF